MSWLSSFIRRNARQSNTTQQITNGEARVEIFLKEYELCTSDANHLEDSIWTVTSLLIAATGAGIGFLSSTSINNLYGLVIHIGISLFSLAIVRIWYKIVMRWHSIQNTIYFRSEDIENHLQYIHKNQEIRYFLDKTKESSKKIYGVSESLKRIHLLLMITWFSLLIFQVAWYSFQVTGLSTTISWLSAK